MRLTIRPLSQDPLGMLLQAQRGQSSGIPIHSVLLACFVNEFYVLLFKVCFENLLKLPEYFRKYFKNSTSEFFENATASVKRSVIGNWIFRETF